MSVSAGLQPDGFNAAWEPYYNQFHWTGPWDHNEGVSTRKLRMNMRERNALIPFHKIVNCCMPKRGKPPTTETSGWSEDELVKFNNLCAEMQQVLHKLMQDPNHPSDEVVQKTKLHCGQLFALVEHKDQVPFELRLTLIYTLAELTEAHKDPRSTEFNHQREALEVVTHYYKFFFKNFQQLPRQVNADYDKLLDFIQEFLPTREPRNVAEWNTLLGEINDLLLNLTDPEGRNKIGFRGPGRLKRLATSAFSVVGLIAAQNAAAKAAMDERNLAEADAHLTISIAEIERRVNADANRTIHLKWPWKGKKPSFLVDRSVGKRSANHRPKVLRSQY